METIPASERFCSRVRPAFRKRERRGGVPLAVDLPQGCPSFRLPVFFANELPSRPSNGVVVRARTILFAGPALVAAACSVPDESTHGAGVRRLSNAPPAMRIHGAAFDPRERSRDVAEDGPPVAAPSAITRPPAVAPRDAPHVDRARVEPAPRLSDADIDWDKNPVLTRLARIAETMTHTEYTHGFEVDEARGVYRFDCSGMVQWVLRRAAPRAAAAARYQLDHRPLARDYQRRIASVPLGKERYGWRRIGRIVDAEPGDVIAWIRPAVIRSPNTGHVAFIALPPVPVPGYDNAFLVRVIDSTSLLHDDDTRQGRSGFGLGTILLVADEITGEPRAFGWIGLEWRAFATDIAIGRPTE